MSTINSASITKDPLETWLVDLSGNVAMSVPGLDLLKRIKMLLIPAFVSTEHAMDWGSRLSGEEHATLIDMQRTASNAARTEPNLQSRAELATRSQLMREAAEAFRPGLFADPRFPRFSAGMAQMKGQVLN